MAGFLVASTSVVGHVTPTAQVVRCLVGRGHDVHWYTGAGLREPVEAAGATFHPITHEIDFTLVTPSNGRSSTPRPAPTAATRAFAGTDLTADDLSRHDAPAEAADLLEELARTGKPVLRQA